MFAVAVDQLVNCPRGVRPRARRHSVSVCQVVGPSNLGDYSILFPVILSNLRNPRNLYLW